MAKSAKSKRNAVSEPPAITEIRVAGFKSIADEQSIKIQPLTLLAGANSSGKSSMMQPLLLLKQTLEATYDAGPIMLNGPNVKFAKADELLSRIGRGRSSASFQVGLELNGAEGFQLSFHKEQKMAFGIEWMDVWSNGQKTTFSPEMTQAEIVKTGITNGMDFSKIAPEGYRQGKWEIKRDRCFIGPAWVAKGPNGMDYSHGGRPGPRWEEIIPHVFHLPGLRGNRERAYRVTAVGPPYLGTFEEYTASVISHWENENVESLNELNGDLKFMKLAGGVTAVRLYDVQIELYVGRLPELSPSRQENRVNIADVGLGVSQTLPVLVALHAARPGQLVYLEQPETHLHPQAQFALAKILASAANRGVRIVAETHSTHLLLGVQTQVAEGKLDADKVKLHWFQREKDGHTVVRSGDLDEAGRFGAWPQDFDDVELHSQKRYLDAAHERLMAGKHG